MKTLADIKRRAVRGARLTIEYHAYGTQLTGQTREIVRVQGNAVAFLTQRKDGSQVESWLFWPKASLVKVTSPDTFDVIFGADDAPQPDKIGSPFISYRFAS